MVRGQLIEISAYKGRYIYKLSIKFWDQGIQMMVSNLIAPCTWKEQDLW
jgi:hypothetical protein